MIFTRHIYCVAIALLLFVCTQAAQSRSPGDTFKDCSVCPEMVVVPAGSFRMGDINGGGDSSEKSVHQVTIAEPFAVGKYEITFDEWDACVADGGCKHKPVNAGSKNHESKVSLK